MRAAVVGGVAYHAGKKSQQGRDAEAEQDARLDDIESQQQAAPAAPAAADPGGISSDTLDKLKELGDLKTQGILTDAEFEAQKQKLLESS
jgi:hypothetical protein